MALLKVVLDTNAILRSISRRSEFSIVFDKLSEGAFALWVTNDILLEYEEKISDIFRRKLLSSYLALSHYYLMFKKRKYIFIFN